MAGFVFQYETLLRHRRTVEETRQRELSALMSRRVGMENELRSMQEMIGRSKRDLGGALVGSVDLERVSRFARYSGEVAFRAHGLVREIAGLERQVEAARRRLVAARRERRALELLRDRRLASWRREQTLRETAELDDLSAGVYARRSMEVES